MPDKKVTDNFSRSVTRSKNRVTGDRSVTDKKINLSPRKSLFFSIFLPIGDRVTDKIEIIGYIYNRANKGKTGIRAPEKRTMRRTRKHLSPVTPRLVGPIRRVTA